MFTGSEKSDRLYSAICEEVCKALESRKAGDSDLLRVFTLNKIDLDEYKLNSAMHSLLVKPSEEAPSGRWSTKQALLPMKDDGTLPSI